MKGKKANWIKVLALIALLILISFGVWLFNFYSNKEDEERGRFDQVTQEEDSNNLHTAKNAESEVKTNEEAIQAAMTQYCRERNAQTEFVKNDNEDDPNPMIQDDFSRISGSCRSVDNSDEVDDNGFSAVFFLRRIDDTWRFQFFSQQQFSCEQLDGKGWPVEITGQCWDQSNSIDGISGFDRDPR